MKYLNLKKNGVGCKEITKSHSLNDFVEEE